MPGLLYLDKRKPIPGEWEYDMHPGPYTQNDFYDPVYEAPLYQGERGGFLSDWIPYEPIPYEPTPYEPSETTSNTQEFSIPLSWQRDDYIEDYDKWINSKPIGYGVADPTYEQEPEWWDAAPDSKNYNMSLYEGRGIYDWWNTDEYGLEFRINQEHEKADSLKDLYSTDAYQTAPYGIPKSLPNIGSGGLLTGGSDGVTTPLPTIPPPIPTPIPMPIPDNSLPAPIEEYNSSPHGAGSPDQFESFLDSVPPGVYTHESMLQDFLGRPPNAQELYMLDLRNNQFNMPVIDPGDDQYNMPVIDPYNWELPPNNDGLLGIVGGGIIDPGPVYSEGEYAANLPPTTESAPLSIAYDSYSGSPYTY